jgi:MFS transporter, ACS family, glucarate transporter
MLSPGETNGSGPLPGFLNNQQNVFSTAARLILKLKVKDEPMATHSQTSTVAGLPVAKATSVRWVMMGMIMAIMAVTALNRLNLSIAGEFIEQDFSFDTITMGRIFSSFLWGYGLFQIPWGYICDRVGPRRTLTASMLLFAIGSAAMGITPKLAGLTGLGLATAFSVVRLVTGIGEAAVSSNVTRVIALWTGVRERGFASSLQVCGLGLGGTLTPVFIAWMMLNWGWRFAFEVCGGLAFLVILVWHRYATDWPEQHRKVNSAELAKIHRPDAFGTEARLDAGFKRQVPWLKMLGSRSVWGLILAYGLQGYGFYVYYNWFYFYAVKFRGLPLMQAAVWTSAPFLAMACLSPIGGWFSDKVSRSVGRRRGRMIAVWLGMGLAAMLLFSGSHISVTAIALPMIALAAGFHMFAAAIFWASCIDLAPNYSASLSALMNTLGSVGGAISSTVTAYVVIRAGWSHALDIAALITIGSGLLFSFVNVEHSIEG